MFLVDIIINNFLIDIFQIIYPMFNFVLQLMFVRVFQSIWVKLFSGGRK